MYNAKQIRDLVETWKRSTVQGIVAIKNPKIGWKTVHKGNECLHEGWAGVMFWLALQKHKYWWVLTWYFWIIGNKNSYINGVSNGLYHHIQYIIIMIIHSWSREYSHLISLSYHFCPSQFYFLYLHSSKNMHLFLFLFSILIIFSIFLYHPQSYEPIAPRILAILRCFSKPQHFHLLENYLSHTIANHFFFLICQFSLGLINSLAPQHLSSKLGSYVDFS